MARRSQPKRSAAARQARRAKYASARHDLSKLKSKGLISPRANLRKEKPSSGLLKKLKVLRPVLEGKASVVRLPAKQRRDFKDVGYFTSRGFTVIPTSKGEKVSVNKDGLPVLKGAPRPQGGVQGAPHISRVLLPTNIRDFEAFEKFMFDHPDGYNGHGGGSGYYYSIAFYGNKSSQIMRWRDLLEFVKKYNLFEDRERFEALVIYELNYEGQKQWKKSVNKERDERKAARRKSYHSNTRLTAEQRVEKKAKDAERNRRNRAIAKQNRAIEKTKGIKV